MTFRVMYPMIATDKLAETRAFYVRLGFVVVCEGEWHLHLHAPKAPHVQLVFVRPGLGDQPPVFDESFAGGGVFYGLEVDDADAEYRRLAGLGLDVAFAPRDEPWGHRHFGVVDPNGIVVDIIQPIAVPGPARAESDPVRAVRDPGFAFADPALA